MLKSYMRLIVPTLAVCIVAAGGLAGTYAVTKDKIAEQDRLTAEKALKASVPDAASFREMDAATRAAAAKAAGDVKVDKVYEALDSSGQVMGWGLILGSRGYSQMTVAVGVDRNGKVTGLTMVAQKETPGLGSKVVTNPDYLARFTGLDSPSKAAKVDAITGASKSSKGVKRAAEAALAVYSDVLSKGGAK